jgi:hypothetical protein
MGHVQQLEKRLVQVKVRKRIMRLPSAARMALRSGGAAMMSAQINNLLRQVKIAGCRKMRNKWILYRS